MNELKWFLSFTNFNTKCSITIQNEMNTRSKLAFLLVAPLLEKERCFNKKFEAKVCIKNVQNYFC